MNWVNEKNKLYQQKFVNPKKVVDDYCCCEMIKYNFDEMILK